MVLAFWRPSSDLLWWIGVCNSCEQPVLVLNQGDVVWPTPLPQPTDEHIPEEIRADLDEAKRCLTVFAWCAAVVMAGRSMQSAARSMGAQQESLDAQLKALAANGKITTDLLNCADVVRILRNAGAHPDSDPVSQEEAEQTVALAEQFLHVLFVTPARTKALRAKRTKPADSQEHIDHP